MKIHRRPGQPQHKDLSQKNFKRKVEKALKGFSNKEKSDILWCHTPYPFGTRRTILKAARLAVRVGLYNSRVLYDRYERKVMEQIREQEKKDAKAQQPPHPSPVPQEGK